MNVRYRETDSTFPYKNVDMTWTIPDIVTLLQHTCNIKELRVVHSGGTQLKLKFHGNEKDIELSYCSATRLNDMTGMVDVVILNNNGLPGNKNINKIGFPLVDAGLLVHLATLYKRDIINEPKEFLFYDKLYLNIIFKYKKCVTNEPANETPNQLKKLLNNIPSADVVIKSKDGREYNVHKAKMASQSDVLKALFKHETTEDQTNVIEAPFDSAVLEEVLYFIFYDLTPRIKELAKDTLAAADYYQIDRLKYLCEKELVEQLTKYNAREMLELANLFQTPILKTLALKKAKKLYVCKELESDKSWKGEYYI